MFHYIFLCYKSQTSSETFKTDTTSIKRRDLHMKQNCAVCKKLQNVCAKYLQLRLEVDFIASPLYVFALQLLFNILFNMGRVLAGCTINPGMSGRVRPG